MRIRVVASLGFAGADWEDEIDVDEEDFDLLITEDLRNAYLSELAWEYGVDKLETWYEVVE